jgi:hypothetical protein
MTFTNQPLPEPDKGQEKPAKPGADLPPAEKLPPTGKQSSLLKPVLNAIIRAKEARP